MRSWKFVGSILVLSIAVLVLLEAMAFSDIRVLTDDQKSLIAGGGNCMCRKSNACGSVYCYKSGANWVNCSGNTSSSFCVKSSKSSDSCDSDGDSISCGVFQTCTTSQCSTCTPGSTTCNRTSAGTDGDTDCPAN